MSTASRFWGNLISLFMLLAIFINVTLATLAVFHIADMQFVDLKSMALFGAGIMVVQPIIFFVRIRITPKSTLYFFIYEAITVGICQFIGSLFCENVHWYYSACVGLSFIACLVIFMLAFVYVTHKLDNRRLRQSFTTNPVRKVARFNHRKENVAIIISALILLGLVAAIMLID